MFAQSLIFLFLSQYPVGGGAGGAFSSSGGIATGVNIQEFTTVGSNTWSKPTGGTLTCFQIVGAGGGGGAGTTTSGAGGNGANGYIHVITWM